MKTSTFKLDLMQSGSAANKDLVYNENILKIDCLMNNSAIDLVSEIPKNIEVGCKYIINGGEHKGKICYRTHPLKPISLLEPSAGQVLFIQSMRCFLVYDGKEWTPVESTSSNSGSSSSSSSSSSADNSNNNVAIASNTLLTGDEKFIGIEGEYSAPEDHEFLHLYVNDDVQINLDQVKTRLVTFIIKQHYQDIKQFSWPDNILWQNKTKHQLSAKANATDIVRIYRLVETNHFLGEIVGQDYQF